jgi:hypothetical protein
MERISNDRLRTESQSTCSANHHSHCAELAFLAISNTHLISSELAQDDESHSGFNLDSPLGRGAYRGGSGRWRRMVATARPKVRAYPVAQSMRPCRAASSAEFPPKLSTIAAPLLPASFQGVTTRSSISNAPAATMPKNSPLPMPLFRLVQAIVSTLLIAPSVACRHNAPKKSPKISSREAANSVCWQVEPDLVRHPD